jgi:hypothetical protein
VGKPPQSITVSLAAPRYVCRYVYFARASGVNGIVTQYLLEGRNGGGEWFTLASGTWPGTTASVSTVDFSPVWLTDVRLTVLAAAGGTNDWPCAAEINLYEWVEEKFEALQVEIPQSVMTASADDEMNAMEHSNDVAAGNGPADFAIDGKTTTWWSTDYYVNAPLPHALTLDLGGVHKVTKVVYYARTTIGNGNIKQYELEGLTPDSQWVPLAAGAWSGALSEVNTVTFTPTLVTAIRLTAITTTKEPQACVTELKVFEELYDAGPIDIQPIAAYNTVTSLDDTTLAVASRIANNTEEIQGVIPALALYDGSGRLVSVSYGGSIEIAPQGEVQVTHGFDTLAPNVRCDAKLFFFSADDYTPLTDDFTFKL